MIVKITHYNLSLFLSNSNSKNYPTMKFSSGYEVGI